MLSTLIEPQLITSILLLVAAGALAGMTAGLFGVGGGTILVPAFTMALSWLGVAADAATHVAIATSLATILPTSLISLRTHARHGAFDGSTMRRWGPWLVVGAIVGAVTAPLVPMMALRLVFALFCLSIALRFLLPPASVIKPRQAPSHTVQQVMAGVIGVLSALLGIGGGALGVPALHYCGLPLHRAIGTASAFGFAVALPGTIVYLLAPTPAGVPFGTIGLVHGWALLLLVPLALIMAPIGASLAHRLPMMALRRCFAALLVIIGGKMLLF